MTVPDQFHDQDHYNEWLEDLAETEMENYLRDMGDEALHVDSVHEYVYESPALDGGSDMEWAQLYFDVREYCNVWVMERKITIPHDDPFAATAIAVQMAIREDLACRVHEMLEDEGYEVGPPHGEGQQASPAVDDTTEKEVGP